MLSGMSSSGLVFQLVWSMIRTARAPGLTVRPISSRGHHSPVVSIGYGRSDDLALGQADSAEDPSPLRTLITPFTQASAALCPAPVGLVLVETHASPCHQISISVPNSRSASMALTRVETVFDLVLFGMLRPSRQSGAVDRSDLKVNCVRSARLLKLVGDPRHQIRQMPAFHAKQIRRRHVFISFCYGDPLLSVVRARLLAARQSGPGVHVEAQHPLSRAICSATAPRHAALL